MLEDPRTGQYAAALLQFSESYKKAGLCSRVATKRLPYTINQHTTHWQRPAAAVEKLDCMRHGVSVAASEELEALSSALVKCSMR